MFGKTNYKIYKTTKCLTKKFSLYFPGTIIIIVCLGIYHKKTMSLILLKWAILALGVRPLFGIVKEYLWFLLLAGSYQIIPHTNTTVKFGVFFVLPFLWLTPDSVIQVKGPKAIKPHADITQLSKAGTLLSISITHKTIQTHYLCCNTFNIIHLIKTAI